MVLSLALTLLSGGLVGFSLGLIGGGGSILATPLLLYVVGVGDAHVAIGTSAFAVSVNAFSGFVGHARCGNVRWRPALVFAGVGTLGALGGSTLGKLVDGERLLFLFGVLMVAVGALMLRPRRAAETPGARAVGGVGAATVGVAFATGLAAGFFGIGGGFLVVPGLIFATGMPMLHAIGSSLFAVGSFGLATALNYAASGLVDWLVALEFIAGGVVGGFAGMRLANRLGSRKQALQRIFSALIFVVAFYVFYRSGGALLR